MQVISSNITSITCCNQRLEVLSPWMFWRFLESGVSALSIGCNEFLSGGADGSLCFWSAGELVIRKADIETYPDWRFQLIYVGDINWYYMISWFFWFQLIYFGDINWYYMISWFFLVSMNLFWWYCDIEHMSGMKKYPGWAEMFCFNQNWDDWFILYN